MKLTQVINGHYHTWRTSTCINKSDEALNSFYKLIKNYTYTIIYCDYKSLKNHSDEIFSIMMEKLFTSLNENKIRTTNYITSWYKKALSNCIIDYTKSLNAKKRANLVLESNLPIDSDFYDKISIEEFFRMELFINNNEMIESLKSSSIDVELLMLKFIDGKTIKELASMFNSTEDAIKSKIKRQKINARNFLLNKFRND